MITSIIIAVVILALYMFFFNSGAKNIRNLQSLINKDRSVCDVINNYQGWQISPRKSGSMKLIINSTMGVYGLYLTYNNQSPTNAEMTQLYNYLMSDDSGIKQAHLLNMPVGQYLEEVKKFSDEL